MTGRVAEVLAMEAISATPIEDKVPISQVAVPPQSRHVDSLGRRIGRYF